MSGASHRWRGCGRAGLLACILLGTPSLATAHPHVFVDYAVALLVAGDSLDGIRLTWTFDDLFRGFILQEFDRDRNQALSPEEVRQIDQKHLTESAAIASLGLVLFRGAGTGA
jgi:ABC-type uncharacterized transport system substrate-binding protein